MDIIVALLQLGSLLVLWRLHLLSAAAAYGAMGGACVIACLAWWLGKGQPIRFSRRGLAQDWRHNWSFGKWALASQLTGLASCALPWLLATVRGEAETGEFAACATLVGLSNLFVMGLNNFLMPKTAQAFARRGVSALRGVLRKALLLSMGVLGSLCVAALFLGDRVAGILFGPEYADTGTLITILALATLVDALVLTASTGLWAMDRPAANLRADVVQMLVTLATALWLVAPQGAMGIAIALVAGRTAGALVRWITLERLMVNVAETNQRSLAAAGAVAYGETPSRLAVSRSTCDIGQ
jgi:O-antigen/teichoic acid export membrane protein